VAFCSAIRESLTGLYWTLLDSVGVYALYRMPEQTVMRTQRRKVIGLSTTVKFSTYVGMAPDSFLRRNLLLCFGDSFVFKLYKVSRDKYIYNIILQMVVYT